MARAPTISCMKPVAGDLSFGWASRLNAAAKLSAVTSAPLWKRNVRCRTKVYVRLSSETVYVSTTSGITFAPAAPAASGLLKSFAHVANPAGALVGGVRQRRVDGHIVERRKAQ